MFNETHQMARRTTAAFIKQHVAPYIQEWEEAGSFPREIYRLAGEAGVLGVGFNEKWGGSGESDILMKVAVSEELMRSTSGGFVASLGSLDIALPPIARWGSSILQDKVIPPVLQGEKIAALAITEPGGGSDVANLQTRAVLEGDAYRINGSKTFITSGHRADFYTVAVRTGGEGHAGISLILVEREREGFSTGQPLKKMGWWASDTAELFFNDCLVPAENLIGPENSGFIAIMSNFLMERLALSIMGYMTAQIAYEQALSYARQRDAFGRKIAKFQVIKHRLVEMATKVEIARNYTLNIAQRIQNGDNPIKEVAMAKNFCSQAAQEVTDAAVQIHGGMGYMRESVVERLYRDARILSIGGGSTEIMNEIIAKQLGL
ncbi:acyl-CoA dehydrogenase family protein [Hahella sp. HN01]|uniref:acyl-CoA dehydrogenase family protein n=1 Tax=Hahella sp. HN01 TaxID=2847262 RepID=UPI001C1EC768|nr:acyl-CoA dehydrogenase family protein [Hahella sp. HN01]MBU6953171.1 acyl-CoA dehydrogenase family protein [Hahella sp. HN01]